MSSTRPRTTREVLRHVLFTTHSKAGHRFDVIITWMIVVSVSVVILETVHELSRNYRHIFLIAEWCFTILFTIEYLLRLYSAKDWKKYAFSFFGIVDLLSFIPSYITAFFLKINPC